MPQNFKNHAKTVPLFHFVALPILAMNFVWSIFDLVRYFSAGTIRSLLVAFALIILAFFARLFALTVQDRVIRLEMRLRMLEILPPDLRPRIPEFTVAQLIALRFAADAELPSLARKVLDEKIRDRAAIKQLVQSWQPDLLRA